MQSIQLGSTQLNSLHHIGRGDFLNVTKTKKQIRNSVNIPTSPAAVWTSFPIIAAAPKNEWLRISYYSSKCHKYVSEVVVMLMLVVMVMEVVVLADRVHKWHLPRNAFTLMRSHASHNPPHDKTHHHFNTTPKRWNKHHLPRHPIDTNAVSLVKC